MCDLCPIDASTSWSLLFDLAGEADADFDLPSSASACERCVCDEDGWSSFAASSEFSCASVAGESDVAGGAEV